MKNQFQEQKLFLAERLSYETQSLMQW